MQFALNNSTLILKIEQIRITDSFYIGNLPYSTITRNKKRPNAVMFNHSASLLINNKQ